MFIPKMSSYFFIVWNLRNYIKIILKLCAITRKLLWALYINFVSMCGPFKDITIII